MSKFSVWKLQDPTTSTWTIHKIQDLTIRRSLGELDRLTFHSTHIVSTGMDVKVLFTSTVVFRGIVTRTKEELGLWEIEAYERAIELKKQLVDYGGKYRHQWDGLKAYEVVDRVLTNSGWVRGVSSNAVQMQKIIPSITIEYADRLKALSKIAKDILKTDLWFTYDRRVFITSVHVDRTKEGNLRYMRKSIDVDESEVYDGVIVLGRGDGINQVVVKKGEGRLKPYIAKDIATSTEAIAVANALVSMVRKPVKRLEITGNAVPRIQEGDLVLVDGEKWKVYEAEHSLDSSRLTCGAMEKSLSRLIRENIKGLREAGYVAQGVTNVSNFGGWMTAVASTYAARYRFFLPDSSVGMIRVNEAFINVYGSAYRIWSKGAAAGSVGVNATPATTQSVSNVILLMTASQFETWVNVASITPSSFTYDVNTIYAEIQLDNDPASVIFGTWYYVRIYDATAGKVLASRYRYLPTSDRTTPNKDGTATSLIVSGKFDKTHTYVLQIYIDTAYSSGFGVGVCGSITAISGHDHGTHVHMPQPGIYETSDYPSKVHVYVNGNLVASPTSHPDLAGGYDFSVTKIDIKDYIQPGENVIEVRSATLGMIEVDGFYRIFVETRN